MVNSQDVWRIDDFLPVSTTAYGANTLCGWRLTTRQIMGAGIGIEEGMRIWKKERRRVTTITLLLV